MEKYSKKCALQFNQRLGRHIIAVNDISPGETIISESPSFITTTWNSEIKCSNCFCKSETLCKICGVFPVCVNCKHHDNFNCTFFHKADIKKNILIQNFNLFGPLNFLLLGENPQTNNTFNFLLNLESHLEKRKLDSIWLFNEENIVQPLLKCGIVAYLKLIKLNSELIQKICGILDVNCFEIRGMNYEPLRAIYPYASLLAHDCLANTSISVDKANNMKIYASIPIFTNEIVSYNYTNPLLGNFERQLNLRLGKYFHCTCRRCSDPTELGTYMSSFKCNTCKNGLVIYTNNFWKCEKCNTPVANFLVAKIINTINMQINEAEGNIKKLQKLLIKNDHIIAKNHYLNIDIKQKLAAILRENFPVNSILQRKIQLCEEIIPVLRLIQPGISRLTGIALYEYFKPFLQLAYNNYKNGTTTTKDHLVKLEEAERILKEAISMLLYEQIETPEGELFRRALFELNDLRSKITETKRSLADIK